MAFALAGATGVGATTSAVTGREIVPQCRRSSCLCGKNVMLDRSRKWLNDDGLHVVCTSNPGPNCGGVAHTNRWITMEAAAGCVPPASGVIVSAGVFPLGLRSSIVEFATVVVRSASPEI